MKAQVQRNKKRSKIIVEFARAAWDSRSRTIHLGLTFGLLDLLVSLYPAPTGLAHPSWLFFTLAATVLASVLLLATVRALLFIVVRLAPGADSFRTSIATGVFPGFLVLLVTFGAMLPLPSLSDRPLFRFACESALALALALIFRHLVRLLSTIIPKSPEWFLLQAAPVFLSLAVGYFWIQLYPGPTMSDRLFYGINVLFLVLAIGIVAFFYLIRRSNFSARPMVWILFALTQTPLFLALRGGPVKFSGNFYPDAKYSDNPRHRVKRVILICVDTMRQDHVRAYSNSAGSTPNMDSLAGDGILFKNARSPGPWTVPAMASMLTGLSPWTHGLHTPVEKLPPTMPTLAGVMHGAGYFTAAIGENVCLSPQTGLSKGHMEYNMYPHPPRLIGASLGGLILPRVYPDQFLSDPNASEITDMAIDWVEANRKKDFFLWLHYFSPHLPYKPPLKYISPDGFRPNIGYSFSPPTSLIKKRGEELATSPPDQKWINQLYRGEIAYADDELGRFLRRLKEMGLYDDSLIILASDHGEEFWDHGGFEHGHTLYDELLRVVLIFKLPFSEAKEKRIEATVSTQSLASTVWDLCGVEPPGDFFESPSLASSWGIPTGGKQDPPIFSTGVWGGDDDDLETVFFEGMKFTRALASNRRMLFDLTADPKENNSISDTHPDLVQRGTALLNEKKLKAESLKKRFDWTGNARIELPRENLDRLKALGYLR